MSNKSSCDSCSSSDCSVRSPQENENIKEFQKRQKLGCTLARIKHTILVLSGKGGVGKSTVATNLALSMSMAGYKTGLLDIDLHGPSIPTILGLRSEKIPSEDGKMLPVVMASSLKVMSVGFLVQDNSTALIWRGPMKAGVIQQFVSDVAWGDLDVLIVDCPPGTGDEPLSIAQLIPKADGAVLVTTPQQVAISDVRRSVSFCNQLNLPVLGIVENMSGFVCPSCGEITNLFKSGGGEALSKEMNVPFLGKIPIDPNIVQAMDDGIPYLEKYAKSPAAEAFNAAVKPLLEHVSKQKCLEI